MEGMTSVQPCPESTMVQEGAKEDHDRYKSGTSMGNGNSGLKPIKTADQIIKPAINSMSYGIPEKSTNDETLPAKESYTAVVPGKEKEDEAGQSRHTGATGPSLRESVETATIRILQN
nr:hypothetical protein CFP56_37636 [Quercus suber]